MTKRKWLVNLSMLVCLMVVFFMLSGFYHQSCSSSSVTVDGAQISGTVYIYFDDESSSVFLGSTSNSLSVQPYINVLYGNTVNIPVTVYFDYQNPSVLPENHSVKAEGSVYPCALVTNDGTEMIAATFSVSYTAAAGAEDKVVTIEGVYTDESGTQSTHTETITLRSVEDLPCEACGSAQYEGGKFVHGVCYACNGACEGEGIVHESCEVCGAVCEGNGLVHGVCTGCEAPCVDGVVAHEACTGCGEACEGSGIVHKQCEACGAVCEGNGLVHGVCIGCEAPCLDGVITHEGCEVCGAVCEGSGITHQDGCALAPTKPSAPSNPSTGDTTLFVYPALALSSLVGMGVLVGKKRR